MSSKFKRVVDQSFQLQELTTEEFKKLLEAFGENVGRRLAASLGEDPDLVFAPDGSDGRRTGKTDFERLLQSVSGPDAVRAVVMAAGVDVIEDFVEAAGTGAAREAVRDAVAKLAGLAERSLVAQGVAAAGALDTVAAEALIGSYMTNTLDEALKTAVDKQAAVKIRQGIIANMGQMTVSELAQQIGEEQKLSVNRAGTEARTQLAAADRFVNDVTRKSVDPSGKDLLLAYIGPDDKITRPFCDHLVNKAFAVKDFDKLRNGQSSAHPRVMGGGWNCRHDIRAVVDDKEILKDLGLTKGDMSDVNRANEAARATRKKKNRRKKR